MTIASFFNSWPGMYVAQSFLHSLIAALIVDTALAAWKIENPLIRQRFRLLVIILPILGFPFYQLIGDDRGSAIFRLDAVFNFNLWMDLQLWGAVPLGILFLLLLLFSTAVFAFQELVPIIRNAREQNDEVAETRQPEPGSPVIEALDSLPGIKPPVHILDEEELVIFSSTGREPAVYISEGLVQSFTPDELRAALAHEFGHIRRSRRPLMVFIFLLRMIMFYNPVILMEFRRIVQEEEKICDDLAVAMTGSRTAMLGALQKFFDAEQDEGEAPPEATQRLGYRIQQYSHALLIETRLARLEDAPRPEVRSTLIFLVVLATIVTVNFYVV